MNATIADAMTAIERDLDDLITAYLVALESRVRLDIAATGPEDDDALDRPPDPGSPWRRMTLDEVVIVERAVMMLWRDRTVAMMRDRCRRVVATDDA